MKSIGRRGQPRGNMVMRSLRCYLVMRKQGVGMFARLRKAFRKRFRFGEPTWHIVGDSHVEAFRQADVADAYRNPDPRDHQLDPLKTAPLWADELARIRSAR